jgi:hypothetical protein
VAVARECDAAAERYNFDYKSIDQPKSLLNKIQKPELTHSPSQHTLAHTTHSHYGSIRNLHLQASGLHALGLVCQCVSQRPVHVWLLVPYVPARQYSVLPVSTDHVPLYDDRLVARHSIAWHLLCTVQLLWNWPLCDNQLLRRGLSVLWQGIRLSMLFHAMLNTNVLCYGTKHTHSMKPSLTGQQAPVVCSISSALPTWKSYASVCHPSHLK